MRLILVLTIALVLARNLFAVPLRPEKKPKETPAQELKKLEGTWMIIYYEKNGLKYSAEVLKQFPLLTFKGSTYSWSNGTRPGKILKIDPTQKPRRIDYEITDGEDKGKIEKGIYEIKGDSLKDCFSPAGGKRPKEFGAAQGSRQTLVVYKRVTRF
jgi:uncharacterized protein (TIGR03067 family)